jgi:hypothetical protein
VERVAEVSPRFKAKMAGFFWLNVLTGSSALFIVGRRLVVYGDASHPHGGGVPYRCDVFFYSLFKPVNRESLYAGGLLQALRDAPLAFLAHFISYPPTSAPWDFSDSTAS